MSISPGANLAPQYMPAMQPAPNSRPGVQVGPGNALVKANASVMSLC
jgi:hypothetical protein